MKDKRKLISGTVLGLFVSGSILVAVLAGGPLIAFLRDVSQVRAWVDHNALLSRISFIGIVVFQLVIAVIPGEPIEFAAGYAFGALEGALLCLVGTFIGGLIVFLLVKRFGVKLLEAFFPIAKIQELKFLSDSKRLNVLIFILFFIPGTPKDILTYAVGLTNANMFGYLILSNLARIPSVVSSTIAGSAAGQQDYALLIWVYAGTAAVSLLGAWVYRRITARHMAPDDAQNDTNQDSI